MIYRFPIRNIKDMLLNQIYNNFFKSIDDEMLITKHLPKVLERFEKCISHNENKYYYKLNDAGIKEPFFDPLHTCQWLLFLYLTANTIYKYETEKKESARIVCDKIYGQSKNVSGCDLYYEVEMPNEFSFDAPIGSFMGRAKYGEHFSFSQGCTVGNDGDEYPVLGSRVVMMPGSKIIGKSIVGDNCIISAGTLIKDQNIPANSYVGGKSPNLIIIPHERSGE